MIKNLNFQKYKTTLSQIKNHILDVVVYLFQVNHMLVERLVVVDFPEFMLLKLLIHYVNFAANGVLCLRIEECIVNGNAKKYLSEEVMINI